MEPISSSPRVSSGRRGGSGSLVAGPITRLNGIAGWAMFAVVALAPIPFASNRPFFWALWAAVSGGVGLWYLASARLAGAELRVPLRSMAGLAAAFLAVALFMALQILPIGTLIPVTFHNQFGDAFASRTLSSAPADTALALLRWGTYGTVFFLLVQAGVQEKRNRMMMRGLLAVTVLEAAYALVALTQLGDTILFFDKSYYGGSATGTFVNRNSLATFLGLGMVVATALITRAPDGDGKGRASSARRDPWRLTLLFASVLLLLAALVATQSRMGLFASVSGVAVVLVLRRTGGTVGAAVVALASVAAVIFLYGSGVAERVLTLEQSAYDRLQLYRQTIGMILERPLTGYGAGSFGMAFPAFHEPSLPVNVTWDLAHSTYLALWSGLGLVVGTIPLLIVAAIVFRLLSNRQNRARPSVERTAAIGATVTVAVHSLVDFSLEMQAVALMYVAILALGSARPLSASASRQAA